MRSETLDQLAAALVKAQAAIQPAVKDKTNPAFRSKYADLSAVWEACRKPLTDNGLSIIQMPVEAAEPGRIALETLLLHVSGQYIASVVSAPLVKNDPQGVGSALTYLRRYALAAMVGVVADEDDAGNAASKTTRQPASYHASEPPADDAGAKAHMAFLAYATEQTGKKIGSWRDAMAWLGEEYAEPRSADEWRSAGALIRDEVKRRAQPVQPPLSDEYDAIEAAEPAAKRKNAAAGVGR